MSTEARISISARLPRCHAFQPGECFDGARHGRLDHVGGGPQRLSRHTVVMRGQNNELLAPVIYGIPTSRVGVL